MSKQGCDNHCETCNSANHAYCAIVIAKSNQQAITDMKAILEGMRETKVYAPIHKGADNTHDNNNLNS